MSTGSGSGSGSGAGPGSLASQIQVRVAGPADVDAVVALVESAYRGEASRAGWTTEADWLDGQRTDAAEVGSVIESPQSEILLLEALFSEALSLGNRPSLLGSCQIGRRGDGAASFGMFAVRPDGQGRGSGAALLAEAERRAVETWGATTLRMSVLEVRGDLIAWYERRGYRRTGETEPFPYGNEAFGLPRVKNLRFVVLTKRLGTGLR